MSEDPRAPQGYLSTRSFAELLSKLFRDVTDLFLKETDLIRSEMNEKVTQLQTGIGKIAAGAIVLLVALIVLSDAMVVAIAELLSSAEAAGPKTGWAAVIVGGVFGAIGAFLVRSGTGDLRPLNLRPDRTALQMRRDTDLAKDQVR